MKPRESHDQCICSIHLYWDFLLKDGNLQLSSYMPGRVGKLCLVNFISEYMLLVRFLSELSTFKGLIKPSHIITLEHKFQYMNFGKTESFIPRETLCEIISGVGQCYRHHIAYCFPKQFICRYTIQSLKFLEHRHSSKGLYLNFRNLM